MLHHTSMRILTVLALVLAASASHAQGVLQFDTETLDFGRIAEVEGPVTHSFRFTNAGDGPLRLVQVSAACGCTTPEWTEDVVEPGDGGEVVVTYDPSGRPGDFEKAVFVQAVGAEVPALTLRITGVVRPRLADAGERIGSLAFNHTVAEAGEAVPGERLQTSFQFANVGERPVRVERVEAPDGVEVTLPQRPVFPDGLGGLFVSVEDPAQFAEDDTVTVDLVMFTTDEMEPVKRLRVVGRMIESRVGG